MPRNLVKFNANKWVSTGSTILKRSLICFIMKNILKIKNGVTALWFYVVANKLLGNMAQ